MAAEEQAARFAAEAEAEQLEEEMTSLRAQLAQ